MTVDPRALLRPHVTTIPLYQPGKPIEEVERELGIVAAKLASNENALGPAPEVVEAIREAASRVHLYPETEAPVLRRALATRLGVEESAILITAGASHLLEILGLSFVGPGLAGLTPWPSFIHYVIASMMAGGTCVRVRGADPRKATVDEVLASVTEETRLVFVANPNNPTGAYHTRAELEDLLARLPPHVVLVWDEAYFEFATAPDYPNGLAYVADHPRLIVARSMSKVYALAGLRVGFGVGHPSLIAELARVRGPFKLSSVAQAAALAALGATDHLARSVRLAVEERTFLAEGFERLGLRAWPSQTNFVAVDMGSDARLVAARLERHGFIVRPLEPFGLPTWLRVTVGTREQDEGLLEALTAVLGSARHDDPAP